MKKIFALALAAATFIGTTSHAATLGGDFTVFAVNFDAGGVRGDVHATLDNFTDAASVSGAVADVFSYKGLIDFGVRGPQRADFTVEDWLKTGTGTYGNLSSDLGDSQLSFPTFTTTTMFLFTATYGNGFDFDVQHDDGFASFDDGVAGIKYENATGVRNTNGGTFDGGVFSLLYVAANGNPSVLNVTGDNVAGIPPVPLPASGLLLLGALGFLGAKRRKA